MVGVYDLDQVHLYECVYEAVELLKKHDFYGNIYQQNGKFVCYVSDIGKMTREERR